MGLWASKRGDWGRNEGGEGGRGSKMGLKPENLGFFDGKRRNWSQKWDSAASEMGVGVRNLGMWPQCGVWSLKNGGVRRKMWGFDPKKMEFGALKVGVWGRKNGVLTPKWGLEHQKLVFEA